jgi:hypothetical protein
VQAHVSLYNDPSGIAVLLGNKNARAELPSGGSAVLYFTNLRIDNAALGYRLRFQVFTSDAELPDLSGFGGVSTAFSVGVGDAVAARAAANLVAKGNGTCAPSPAGSVWTLSITLRVNTTNYFNGFLVHLSDSTGNETHKFGGPLVITSHDDVEGKLMLSPPLLSERLTLNNLCNDGNTVVMYAIYAPGGYFGLDIAGADLWPSASGHYEPGSVQLVGGRPVFRQKIDENRSVRVSGSSQYAGIYGMTEYLFAGNAAYRRDGGNYFLRQSISNSEWEITDELGGDILWTISRSNVAPWKGFHILIFDEISSNWIVRKYSDEAETSGQDIISARLTAGPEGWSCIGCQRVGAWENSATPASAIQLNASGGIWVPAPRLVIHQRAVLLSVDEGANIISPLHSGVSYYSVSQVLPNKVSVQEIISMEGASVATSFASYGDHFDGREYIALASPTSGQLGNPNQEDPSLDGYNESYAGSIPGSGYAVDTRLFRWTTDHRHLHIIDNGNLRGNGSSFSCPSGWTCSGTVSSELNHSLYQIADSIIEPPRCVSREAGTGWPKVISAHGGYLSFLAAAAEWNPSTRCTGSSGLVYPVLDLQPNFLN